MDEYEASIRIVDCGGDRDDLAKIHLVGPYMDEEEAQEEVERLEAIVASENTGRFGDCSLGFETSDLSNGSMISPEKVELVSSVDDIEALIYSR